MHYIEIKVTFDHTDPGLAADLIAGAFFDFDLQGVVIEDPGLDPAEDWAEDAVARPAAHAVIGYFPEDGRAEAHCRVLQARIGRLAAELGFVHRVRFRQLDEQDWAESWKAFFWPQKIGARIVVKPSWRDYEAGPGEIVIELDPGMAFGTGTHPTTGLCVALIETYLRPGAAFLDIGTGSGILMAAAGKLGAGRVCGGDRDELAVRIAAANLARNGIAADRVCLAQGLLAEPFRQRFDLIAANILTHVIVELIEDIPRLLAAGGVFICSGIIAENRDTVTAKMGETGLAVLEVREREDWVAIACRPSPC
jgi:ribosomal protein L11 methyltransferase